jgi:hypothetical protein
MDALQKIPMTEPQTAAAFANSCAQRLKESVRSTARRFCSL